MVNILDAVSLFSSSSLSSSFSRILKKARSATMTGNTRRVSSSGLRSRLPSDVAPPTRPHLLILERNQQGYIKITILARIAESTCISHWVGKLARFLVRRNARRGNYHALLLRPDRGVEIEPNIIWTPSTLVELVTIGWNRLRCVWVHCTYLHILC